jgi:hypothetical protein
LQVNDDSDEADDVHGEGDVRGEDDQKLWLKKRTSHLYLLLLV